MSSIAPASINQLDAILLQQFDVVKDQMSDAGWLFIIPSESSTLTLGSIGKGCWRRVCWLKRIWNWFWALFKYPTTSEQCRKLNTMVFKKLNEDLKDAHLIQYHALYHILMGAVGVNHQYSLLIDYIKRAPATIDEGYFNFFKQPFELMVETLSSNGWYFVMPSQQPASDLNGLQTGKWVRVPWLRRLIDLFWSIFGFRSTAEQCRVINKKQFSSIVLDQYNNFPNILIEKVVANNQLMQIFSATALHVATSLQQQQFLIHFNYAYIALSEFVTTRYDKIMRGLIQRNSALVTQSMQQEAVPSENQKKKVKKYQTLPAPKKDEFSLATSRPYILKLKSELERIEEVLKADVEALQETQDQKEREDKLRLYQTDQDDIGKLMDAFNTIANLLKPPPTADLFPASPNPSFGSPFRNIFKSPIKPTS